MESYIHVRYQIRFFININRWALTLKIMLVISDIRHSAFWSDIGENFVGLKVSHSDIGLDKVSIFNFIAILDNPSDIKMFSFKYSQVQVQVPVHVRVRVQVQVQVQVHVHGHAHIHGSPSIKMKRDIDMSDISKEFNLITDIL